MRLKIAVVVHGRFHAFDLARALLARGHDVVVFTNYPRWAAARFGLPHERVKSFWVHGALTRAARRLHAAGVLRSGDGWAHPVFGRWAWARVRRERWDVVHAWSGVAEETLRGWARRPGACVLMRGSAHVRAQARLLEEEERRTGVALDRPSSWMIAREEREYALAGAIAVPSSFAYETFVREGVPAQKLWLLPLGVSVDGFRPGPEVVDARCARILSGQPIRVLNVGTFSFQKGMWDMAAAIRELRGDRFEFRFVGPVAPEAARLSGELSRAATFVPKRPQRELPLAYAWGDVFTLPTIQDGFQTVLGQAAASALPILTTPHGAGRDLVLEGLNGWVVPPRAPGALIERLRWCDAHRAELAALVRRMYERHQPRDWAEVAADFEAMVLEHADAGARDAVSDG